MHFQKNCEILKSMISYLLLISLYFLGCKNDSLKENPEMTSFKPSVVMGLIQDSLLAEASGIIASRSNQDMFWVINDSGNEPILFLINKSGETIHSYWIDGIDNYDWEDLGMYTDITTGKNKLYIGDIGDNFAIRDHINVIVFDEPKIQHPNDTILYEYQNYCFRYEDGIRDAETILVDPVDSRMYIISKREEHARIYEAPKNFSATDTMQLIYKLSLPLNNITSGDISPDGKDILVKSYNSILYWKREKNESLHEVWSRDFELINYVPEPQGESICWAVDGNGFFTLSEKSWSDKQVLYYYERNTP